MTTEERIESLQARLYAAADAFGDIQEELTVAENDLFRGRYGFASGDWVLYDKRPSKVLRVVVGNDPTWDQPTIKPWVEKEHRFSYNTLTLWRGDWRQRITSWPANRPLPEVKP